MSWIDDVEARLALAETQEDYISAIDEDVERLIAAARFAEAERTYCNAGGADYGGTTEQWDALVKARDAYEAVRDK